MATKHGQSQTSKERARRAEFGGVWPSVQMVRAPCRVRGRDQANKFGQLRDFGANKQRCVRALTHRRLLPGAHQSCKIPVEAGDWGGTHQAAIAA
eukprot:362020-Chlamydomonas_euryale.AAC.7